MLKKIKIEFKRGNIAPQANVVTDEGNFLYYLGFTPDLQWIGRAIAEALALSQTVMNFSFHDEGFTIEMRFSKEAEDM